MASFPSDDPIWEILAAIDDEPTGEFSELVKAAQLDPKSDFRNAFLVNVSLEGADISGFDFSGSDLRGTGLRYAAKWQDVVISKDTTLDPADQEWWDWDRERAKPEKPVLAPGRVDPQSRTTMGLGEPLVAYRRSTEPPWGVAPGGAMVASWPVFGSPFHSRAEAATAVR